MDLKTTSDLIKNLLLKIPFNFLDYFLAALLIVFIYEEILNGLIFSFLNFSSIVISFFLALFFYSKIAVFLIQNLSIAKGLSDAFAFLLVGMTSYFLIGIIFNSLIDVGRIYLPEIINYLGGIIFGFISFILLSSFFLSVVLSLPISSLTKNIIKNSLLSSLVLTKTGSIEADVRMIFGGAGNDLLNFLTVESSSNQSLKLNFSVNNPSVNKEDEQVMFALVNNERKSAGLPNLLWDEYLAGVARLHARDMFMSGYFSHYSLSGLSPFDRLEKANVNYSYAGENLAFAPSAELAMSGLMKSPGHRANILNASFKKAGIGVADGGIYGEMFVQEFTD